MPDEVIPESGLAEGETMRVTERIAILESGQTIMLRRFTVADDGRRQWLADGRWCAQLGGVEHLYAAPSGGLAGKGTASRSHWQYRAPHSFATWQDALEAARQAELAAVA